MRHLPSRWRVCADPHPAANLTVRDSLVLLSLGGLTLKLVYANVITYRKSPEVAETDGLCAVAQGGPRLCEEDGNG